MNKKTGLIIGAAVVMSLLVFVAIVKAQSMGAKPQIGPDQIRILSAPAGLDTTNVKLLALDANGFYQVVVNVPATLSVGTGGALALNVTVPSQPTVIYPTLNVDMVRQTDGTYTSAVPPAGRTMRVWRNGILAYKDISYTADVVNASHVIPMSVWSSADKVTCDLIPVQ